MNNNTLVTIIILLVVLVGGYFLLNRPSDTTPESTTDMTAEDTDGVDMDGDMNDEDATDEGEEMMEDDNEMMMETVTMTPDPENAEKQSGSATFEETDEGVTVTVNVTGYETDVPQPAHIHMGACPDVGDVVYPLENLMNGTSTTVLTGVTLDMLRGQYPLGLNVHKSAQEVSVYTSCGDLEF